MIPLNRIEPALPAGAYKTFQIVTPVSTHFRPATCAEAHCPAYEHGWITRIDEKTELGQKQAHYIRREAKRGYFEERDEAGLTVFQFPPGQRCFASGDHKVRLDRPEHFLVRGGDHRGDPTGQRPVEHTRPEFWTEEFAEHQQMLADRIDQG